MTSEGDLCLRIFKWFEILVINLNIFKNIQPELVCGKMIQTLYSPH